MKMENEIFQSPAYFRSGQQLTRNRDSELDTVKLNIHME